jgi:hypothetical protein
VSLPATPLPRPTRDPELQDLFDALVQARSEHRHELGKRMDPTLVLLTRRAWLAALEAYADALATRCLPTPPAVHRDIEILRLLCAHVVPRKGGPSQQAAVP